MNSLFYLFSSLALTSGMMVIGSRNPVHSVLFLILVFFNSAGLLILLQLDFFGMIFLVVYVGAIAVLFLFVVMMLNVRLTDVLKPSRSHKKFPHKITCPRKADICKCEEQKSQGEKRHGSATSSIIVEKTSLIPVIKEAHT